MFALLHLFPPLRLFVPYVLKELVSKELVCCLQPLDAANLVDTRRRKLHLCLQQRHCELGPPGSMARPRHHAYRPRGPGGRLEVRVQGGKELQGRGGLRRPSLSSTPPRARLRLRVLVRSSRTFHLPSRGMSVLRASTPPSDTEGPWRVRCRDNSVR